MIPTRKDDLTEEEFGVRSADPYRWLEGDPQEPELNVWLTAQADAAKAYFAAQPVRDAIRDELKALAEHDTCGVPIPKQGKYFHMQRAADQDLAALYVRDGLDGEPRLLIDPNTLSPDKTTVLGGWTPSRDGRLLKYSLSVSGNDKHSLHVLDVETGKNLPDTIPDDIYPSLLGWNADATGFWYLRRDPDAPADELKYHKRVYFHVLGTDPAQDAYVWGDGFGKEWYPFVSLSHDGKYLLGAISGQSDGENWNELYIKEADSAEEFRLVLARVPGAEFGGHIHRDRFYVVTNDGAPNWKLMSTSVEAALVGKPEFADVIPESEDVLEGYRCVGDRLFVRRLHDVRSTLHECTLDGAVVREIPLPTLGSLGPTGAEPEGKELFFSFSSFAFPPKIYRLDVETGAQSVFFETKVPFDVSGIETAQEWCVSKDGTRVPYFLVHSKGLAKDGTNPTMLYGYGGFDSSLTPKYATAIIPFVSRGGIYVVANLRGGGEFGRAWHEAGMKDKKQNVFDDCIAVAEHLISEGYTSSAKLAIMGASNGGLLVSAVETQRPDLVRAVVCRVPVSDMLRFHLHHGGRHWIQDFGDPDDPTMRSYLFGYSPYHNVKDGTKYPATLIMTSDGDDRVHPLHAYKLAARLQEAQAGDAPILMRVEMKAGHGGAHAVSRAAEQDADLWSFVFDQLGVA